MNKPDINIIVFFTWFAFILIYSIYGFNIENKAWDEFNIELAYKGYIVIGLSGLNMVIKNGSVVCIYDSDKTYYCNDSFVVAVLNYTRGKIAEYNDVYLRNLLLSSIVIGVYFLIHYIYVHYKVEKQLKMMKNE